MMKFIAIRTEIATNVTNATIRVVFTILQSKQHILFAEKRCFYVKFHFHSPFSQFFCSCQDDSTISICPAVPCGLFEDAA